MVYDSSALIAYLLDEPGGVLVGSCLDIGGAVGAANWSETMQKMATKDAWPQSRDVLLSFPIRIAAVGRVDAEAAARLWRRGSGLSLADRLCLALAERLDSEVLTADQVWKDQPRVRLIR